MANVDSRRHSASFRDPDSWILQWGGNRILRRVPGGLLELLGQADVAAFLNREITGGRLVAGTPLSESDRESAGLESSDGGGFLVHPRLPFVTYPYEWSATMLADAARLTLDLQCGLLPLGVELKDATAFNILFNKGQPVFVDWGSFRKPFRSDGWYALGQFHRMFLYPVLLRAIRGWTPAQSFSGRLDGVPLATVVKELGPWLGLLSPSLWLDVVLPSWLEAYYHKKPNRGLKLRAGTQLSPDIQISNLKRIRRLVDRLEARFLHDSVWRDYAVDCHYDPVAEAAKQKSVQEFLTQAAPRSVIDLGCNSGNYSKIASEIGAKVIAADGDEGAIARLYAQLRRAPADIHPVVVNLANPSPSAGWCNRECSAFLERGVADCALALALVHHLRVSSNWPIDQIVDFLGMLGGQHLIAEFVPRDDPMFQAITRLRDEDYADWTLEAWKTSLQRSFMLVREVKLPSSPRTLGLWRRR
jgi:hypothetical protein